ncbi:hypothetical protein Scep_020135 [Stephania cephalantha]|uniref:Amine oxidase domain-containing protein n=1 Tax=Stephania cephalantha TaxID=152367 RepID=A0AAP0NQJ0_9MAGN
MLGMLNYFILSHQSNFDAVWCRGTVREKIFKPWVERIKVNNCQFLEGKKVTDFLVDEETGCISEVVCGKESFVADAVVLAVGISRLQQMIRGSSALKRREEFLKVLKLAGIDVLTATLWLDRKVRIPNAINACFGFDDLSGWAFFDLNTIYDEFKDDSGTVVEANFYRANHLLPLEDEQIVQKVMSCLSKCQNAFKDVNVAKMKIGRYPESLTHYFPGSYEHMMRGATTFPNLFVAGDWIINRHGSWAQEKAFVTGLEAANRVVDYLEEGSFAKIIPLEEDEPHVQSFHSFNRSFNEIRAQLPLSEFFL